MGFAEGIVYLALVAMDEHWVILLGVQEYLESFGHGVGCNNVEGIFVGWNRDLDMSNAIRGIKFDIGRRVFFINQSPI